MLNLENLNPCTVETLKKIYCEHYDTIHYMGKQGTAFEKAIAAVILAASGEE